MSRQMTEKKAGRLDKIEGVLNLVLRDLNGLAPHTNYVGSVVQALVNLVGEEKVAAEMARLAKVTMGSPTPPPTDANGSPVEESAEP